MAVYKTFVYCLISEVEKLQLKMAYFTVFVYLATSLGTSKLLQEKLITNRGAKSTIESTTRKGR